MPINYKQILTYFSSIADHHEQIMSYGFGDWRQITMDRETKQEPKYTRLYIVPQNVEFNQNHIHYNFAIVVADKLEEDLSNQREVLSDTLQIAMDVWTVFWQSYQAQYGDFSEIIVGDWEPDTHPFIDQYETNLAGWTMHIKMSAPFDYNSCDLPIEPFNFPQDESFSSYEQIIADWEQFAENHEQIRSWGFGDPTQITMNVITKQEPEYPRLYFIPDRTRLNPNHMHITWRVIVCDKIEEDLSNQQEVLSDTLEIAKDFFAKAYLSDYDAEFDSVLDVWLEETETTVAGWSFIISVQQKFDYNRCVLPMLPFTEITPTPTPSVTPTTPVETPTPTPTVTSTNTPTVTQTQTPTLTPSLTATNTPTPSVTSTPGASPTQTPTVTPTNTLTPTNTNTPTLTPSVSPTNTVTPTVTPTLTPTNTPTVTTTLTPTTSVTPSLTPSSSPFVDLGIWSQVPLQWENDSNYWGTYSPVGPTPTPTKSNTPTPTITPTNTVTPTITPTLTVTPTVTTTSSPTPTPTLTPSPTIPGNTCKTFTTGPTGTGGSSFFTTLSGACAFTGSLTTNTRSSSVPITNQQPQIGMKIYTGGTCLTQSSLTYNKYTKFIWPGNTTGYNVMQIDGTGTIIWLGTC